MGLENGIIQAPFNTATVSSAIGKASGDVGTLCMAGEPYINKWSFYKPIKYDKPEELSDNEFYTKNDGFNVTISNNAVDCFINGYNGGSWVYAPPTSTDWKRITDFYRYSQNAPAWYQVITDKETYYSNSNIYVEFEAGYSIDWLINNFKLFEDYRGSAINNLALGFIISSSSNPSQVYFYQCTGNLNIFDIAKPRINWGAAGNPGAGTFYIMPVLEDGKPNTSTSDNTWTTLNNLSYTGHWYSLPTSAVQITILNQSTPTPTDAIGVYMSDFNVTEDYAPSTLTSLSINVYNDSITTATQISVTLFAKAELTGNYIQLGVLSTSNLVGGANVNLTWNGTFNILDGYGNINADMSITIGTNVTNKTNISLGKVLEK